MIRHLFVAAVSSSGHVNDVDGILSIVEATLD